MDDPVRPGEILAKKYRVDRVLGVGGMGVVVAATHLELDQRVALKFMHAGVVISPDAMSRFQREARIAVKLRSEHVARVIDTGTLENGAPYIVMEYLEGTDLAAQLTQYGPMPVGFAAECIVQACDAIGEAHSHGVVHRDLKPANLFLTQHSDGSPLVKVLDFGISKASTGVDSGMAMTKTGAIMGSPLYMSPEQLRSLKLVDARADVWALGIILYELLTGRTPFLAETFADLLLQVMTTSTPPLSQLRPDVPPEVSSLVERCLAKEPDARVQSVAEMAEVLAPFCSASGVVLAQRITALARKSGTTGDPRGPNLTGPSMTGGAWVAPPAASPKRTWAWVGGLGLVVVAGGVLVASFAARGGRPAPVVVAASGDVAANESSHREAPAGPPALAASAPREPPVATAASSAPASEAPPSTTAKPVPATPSKNASHPAPAHVAPPPPVVHSSTPPPPPAPKPPAAPGILDTSN